ncbi:phosphodiesterase [Anatilimnocola aggregata]|uniref:Phosphodiesterase n=1 Tax=Anatilimnocola aggregata TaxID=2528021 RepID=A0A517YMY8_9BACT|nr:metallophosphoesterase family protein [Anatilimnocola aggregata]QDU31588.1 phosphodiesterase [Anatilimnocola aggregata]
MKIGILSDTHNEFARARRAAELLQAHGAEVLIHCGDISEPELIPCIAIMPCYFTFGNHDADMVPHLERAIAAAQGISLGWGAEIELDGKRIAVAHGHTHIDVRRLLATKPDYLLSGHLHFPVVRQQDGVRRICPGALHRADEYTVAILDPVTGELQFIRVRD